MATIEDFEKAVTDSKQIKERPSNEDLLQLYALYKQATEGDISGEKPNGFDFKGMAKYNAWEAVKGKSSEDARTEYVELVNRLNKA